MRKWAIYKTEYGKKAREYVDTVEALRKTHLAGIVKAEYLPIVLNRGLGYTSFDVKYEKKEGFLEIVEKEEFPLSREEMFPKNSEKFFWGWIDKEGNTYTCGFEDHSYSADFICKELGYDAYNAERELEKQGWIKISREAPYNCENRYSQAPYCEEYYITKAQYEKLCDIGLQNDWRVEGWFFESEPTW